MTTTREQFEQRLAALRDPWVTRRQLEHLAGVTPKTIRNWLQVHPVPEGKTQTGPRSTQLIDKQTAVEWARARLFGDKEGISETPSGPRLAAERRPMTHAPGERWRRVDIARLRGVTSGAIGNLAQTYADHPSHPFPPAEEDRTRDAAAVAAWFAWYDAERPGYSGKRAVPADTARALVGRVAEVAELLRTAVSEGADLTTKSVAARLEVSPDVAARYLSQAAEVVMPDHGLIARRHIPELFPATVRDQMTPLQQRERVKTLLRRRTAPEPVLVVGGTEYFWRQEVETLVTSA
ncbi:hypothetical protein K7472_20615 [Streptomyces sp. PTM05]|uniref:Uncharacterized protein n=1 Tax=Streptantibioticus parmotrematis TaxID=2873249 RepID=A0ABS7QVJ5_9ACTN|nr:hypothetical protein [Streptantibioticus parmotrematis]MBY8887232.1 hypothetical protein [Streptantibioticus parmotrematis]